MSKEVNVYGVKRAVEFGEGVFLNDLKSDIVTNTGVQGHFKNENSKEDIANIFHSEKVYLNKDDSVLTLQSKMRIVGINDTPFIINNKDLRETFIKYVKLLKEEEEIYILAKAYLYNMLTGSFAFRNRENSTSVKTTISYTFYSKDNEPISKKINFLNDYRFFGLSPFIRGEKLESGNHNIYKLGQDQEDFNNLSLLIVEALRSEDSILDITVVNNLTLFNGALVFPSEDFNSNPSKEKEKQIKTYYKSIAFEQYGMTPEKIGNAFRTVDSFFEDDYENIEVTPVELFGGNLRLGYNLRGKTGMISFQDKLLECEDIEEFINSLKPEERFYILAVYVRGGLLQNKNETGDKKNKKDSKK